MMGWAKFLRRIFLIDIFLQIAFLSQNQISVFLWEIKEAMEFDALEEKKIILKIIYLPLAAFLFSENRFLNHSIHKLKVE